MEKVTIQQYLTDMGYSPPVEETYSHIDTWFSWYQNMVENFHKYSIYDGVHFRNEERYRLGMAKKVCEDWANLILNEKVAIKSGNFEKRMKEILEKNNFNVRGNQLVELTFALGTGAFVEYKNGAGDIVIDFVRADMIYPLSYDNNDVTECAFGSYRSRKGSECVYLQIHRFGNKDNGENPGEYYIENKYVDLNGGIALELPDDLMEIVPTGSEKPLFQILMPNMVNNIDVDSPMGISVYANAIDEIKGCDLVYDSYVNEYVLGRKRILVPVSMAKIMQKEMEIKGTDKKVNTAQPEFDLSQTVFYQMQNDRESDLSLTPIDMSIRAQDHELGIQRVLDLCSFKCGLGTGRYQFNSSGVKTATEVISDKSDLYQNLKKNEIPVRASVIGMVKAIAFLDGYGDVDVTVDFDDSIIEDSNSVIDKNIKLVNGGLRSKLSAVMEINNCSETDAKKELDRIAEDNQITGQSIDWTEGDGDDDSSDDENGNRKIGFKGPDKDGDEDEPSGKSKSS